MKCLRTSGLVLAACALAGPVWAQSAITVDVRGRSAAPAAALRSACPQAYADLPDALAATAQRAAQAAVLDVHFEIDGNRLYELRTEGGQDMQAAAVRRAVRYLGCSNGAAGRQRVHFQVRFVDPFDRRVDAAVALFDLHATASKP